MTKVLVCGEGPGDVGARSWDKRTAKEMHSEGWMQPVIRRLMERDTTFERKYIKEIVTFKVPNHLRPAPHGFGLKAALAKYLAKSEGVELVVFMTDADSADDREYRGRLDEIEEGFRRVENEVSAVACVPKSTSESWLLSDVSAWEGLGLSDKSEFPRRSPEQLWGTRDDPASDHPHQVFSRIAASAGCPDSHETRRMLGETSSLESFRNRCALSFGEFERKLRDLP